MDLDTGTLMIIGSLALCLSGLWLGWAWFQRRDMPSLGWWALANLANGAAVAAMRLSIADRQAPVLLGAFLLIQFPPALVWAGARRFRGARVPVPLLFAGAAIWGAGLLLEPADGNHGASIAVGFLIWATYMFAAIVELWLGRDEVLPARWPLVVILSIDVCVYAGGIWDALEGVLPQAGQPPLDTWFGLIYFEGILYAMGTAVFMSSLASERAETRYRTAASIDMLTGAANRAAFFDGTARMLARCATDRAPLSLIVFDLDRFKSINDTHGHPWGDRVLRVFADTVRNVLRPTDLFGRHGGEEFAIVLPGEGIDTAYAIAERVRRIFAEACREVDGVPLNATVSAGVAVALPGSSLEQLMAAADVALYRAKNHGRNCVRRADVPPEGGGGAKVIRVA